MLRGTGGLQGWLTDMGLIEAGHQSQLGRYIGYMEPYAASHDALDRDEAAQEETANAVRALVQAIKLTRCGELKAPDRARASSKVSGIVKAAPSRTGDRIGNHRNLPAPF